MIVAKIRECTNANMVVKLGAHTDLETASAAKLFFNGIGCDNIEYQEKQYFNADLRESYLLNTTAMSLETAKAIVLIHTNLRMENPLLNSRIRKNYLNNPGLKIFSIGLAATYTTFPVINLGNSNASLVKFCQ